MAKIIRVDLTQKTIFSESLPCRYYTLGGRGLTSQIIFDEVELNCDAFGENNKLVIAPSLSTGTLSPSSYRLSIGTKSPLNAGIKESNAGGTAAGKLANLGIRAIILEGKSEFPAWHILTITNVAVTILSAVDIVGLGKYDTVLRLHAVYGPKVSIMSIGLEGERRMSAANIAISDEEGRACRYCGQGGLGAVMGSKGIKALVIDDKHADEQIFNQSGHGL
jgi:aldehyde:ferredoxin oxidoreductase